MDICPDTSLNDNPVPYSRGGTAQVLTMRFDRVRTTGVSHGRIRIAIDAPSSFSVHREEVYVENREANVQAAKSAVKVKKSKIITLKQANSRSEPRVNG
jgi:sRNA-binding carbon storage regulator CsrA